MTFDRIAVLDWSAANRPRRGKDSIWLGLNDGQSWNPPTRAAALDLLHRLVRDTLEANETLLIGADFAFGYPQGFAQALTGQARAMAVWDWLGAHLTDGIDNRSNRLALAAEINARLPGVGPFWFNPSPRDLPHLPRKGRQRHGHGLAELRACDRAATGAQSVWKLGGAGAVGSQTLTGIAALSRLCRAFPDQIAVWPFQPVPRPVVLAEVFPTLIAPAVNARLGPGIVKDQVQVTLLARALGALPSLAPLLAAPVFPALAEEGWILGLGHEAALLGAI
ncbi:MAG: molybdopterin guanine dinucleotide synthesis [Rhodobacter sp.]|nr:molybdopterin guanine dinucleotide synthesis [Rhodobacter sp.]